MPQLHFAVDIQATRQQVWAALWQNASFRQWASIIDPQTYLVGELKQGNEIQFISGASGYGVTSLVEKLVENEFLLLRHQADTQASGQQTRQKQWTGGTEKYSLAESNGTTTLSIAFEVPSELEAELRVSYPKALECVKKLAETKSRS